jgi:hypothetical protein
MPVKERDRLAACWWVLAGLVAWLSAAEVRAAGPSTPGLRIVISDSVIYGVNLNDARAAMAVWTAELFGKRGIHLAPGQSWVMPSDQLLAAIRAGTVDLFCLSIPEYRKVAQYVDTSRIITEATGGDELLLVVRGESGIANLEGLAGRSLLMLDGSQAMLAEPWLTLVLGREGLKPPRQFFGRIGKEIKVSQVVLPVFFGQTDACMVTRQGFSTMCELNPQLSRKLKVLLVAPRVVRAFLAFHKDSPQALRKPVLDRIEEFGSSAAATQMLTLFQSRAFKIFGPDCLGGANAILNAYERRLTAAVGAR